MKTFNKLKIYLKVKTYDFNNLNKFMIEIPLNF